MFKRASNIGKSVPVSKLLRPVWEKGDILMPSKIAALVPVKQPKSYGKPGKKGVKYVRNRRTRNATSSRGRFLFKMDMSFTEFVKAYSRSQNSGKSMIEPYMLELLKKPPAIGTGSKYAMRALAEKHAGKISDLRVPDADVLADSIHRSVGSPGMGRLEYIRQCVEQVEKFRQSGICPDGLTQYIVDDFVEGFPTFTVNPEADERYQLMEKAFNEENQVRP